MSSNLSKTTISERVTNISKDDKERASPSVFGGASIVACICVGAGMLALPTSGAGGWTVWSTLLLCIAMLAMSASGCCILEVLQTYKIRISIASITKDLLGSKVAVITNLSVYFVGGTLLYAYTTSSGLIIQEFTRLDHQWASILFVAICSLFVWYSPLLVSRISVLLIIFVFVSFIIILSGLLPEIQVHNLFNTNTNVSEKAFYSLFLFPIALASFGYHHSVSTLRDIYQSEHKAQSAIILGTAIALVMYVLWLVAVFGNMPRQSFQYVVSHGGDVDILLSVLSQYIHSDTKDIISSFTAAAILSSFIGVGMGVFDYIADLFSFDNSKIGRGKTLAVTFLPPLFLSLLVPHGFLSALSVAASAAAFWTCIIPTLLVFKVRDKRARSLQQTDYKVRGGNWTLMGILFFGLGSIFIHVLSFTSLLPIFGVSS
ncbi:aromatic amino acid transporter [Vibrio ouci]|uniref:aromatic amino acid transporter n=1 Tax=Vibrio ouci TaxID=2499078 RepID=UPI001FC9AC73|nr:aromatic amino acid transporter [Vibrio ouci]